MIIDSYMENSEEKTNIEEPASQAEEKKEETKLSVEERTAEELRITEKAIEMLRTVFDPEIPVNVYDLGLIYKIDYDVDTKTLHV